MGNELFKITKKILSRLLKKITKFNRGTHVQYLGPFENWEEAAKNSNGYASQIILEKVKTATLEVLNGNAFYERDGTAFYQEFEINTINSVFSKLLEKNALILDFGGGLGSTWHSNKNVISKFECTYYIIEQPNFVKEGNSLSKSYDLPIKYYDSLDNTEFLGAEFAIFSSVLQYLPSWKSVLNEVVKLKPKWIIIDRTPITSGPTQIFVQNNGSYYGQIITYPCWKINENDLIEHLLGYKLTKSWNSNIDPSEYKGYLFEML